MQGYIKLHRKIVHNAIFNDLKLYRLWSLCLINASHRDREILIDGQVVPVKEGQWIVGRFSLYDAYNNGLSPKDRVSGEKTPYRWLEKLEKLGYLSLEKTNKYTVINVVNWGIYQGSDQSNDQQIDHQMTIKRPSNDHQMTTNKNVKNVKNEKNDNNTTTTEQPLISFFESSICRLSEFQIQSLYDWLDDFGGNESIIREAIKIADNQNKRNFNFVQYLLREWSSNKLETVGRVQAYEQEKFNKKKVNIGQHFKQNQTKSIFDQGEESKKRQSALENKKIEKLPDDMFEF